MIAREKAKRRLKSFLLYDGRGTWRDAKHLDLLCQKLEAVERGEIKRLMVFLPPRHGKCIAEGSPVALSDGRFKPIENIVSGDLVYSIDDNNNLKTNKVLKTVCNGKKPVFRMILFSGREIVCTDNHPFLTVEGWKTLSELQSGNSVAGIKEIPLEGGESLPFGFARIMGYLTGDGSFGSGEPRITTVDKATINNLKEITDYHGWILKKYESEKYCYHLRNKRRGEKKSPTEILRKYIQPGTSATKRIPESILNATKKDAAEFLAAYFNCDGTVNEQREGIAEYYSINKKLLLDTQSLLTRFGVYSTLRIKNGIYKGEIHKSFRLIISGGDLVSFANQIPIIGQKGEKLRRVAEKAANKNHYPCQLAIPKEWKNLINLRGINLRRDHGIRIDKKYKIGTARHLVKKVAEITQNSKLKAVCNDSILWEKIEKIECVGEKETYDLQIENNHNFLVSDVVVHNSEVVSKKFPAWYLGRNPEKEIIISSYSTDLALDFSRIARNTLREHASLFDVEIARDSSAVGRWGLEGVRGGMMAAGVGGPITGRGANIFIIDDPLKNWQDAASETIRKSVWDWYLSTARTRLAPGGAIVLVMTRWHEDDLAGKLLSEAKAGNGEEWEVINLPAVAEQNDSLKRKPGEYLWPERFPPSEYENTKRAIGSRLWAALYQQKPAAEDGQIFKRTWWKYYTVLPAKFDEILQSWDFAFKETSDSDFVVGQVWGVLGADRYLIDQVRARMDFPASVQAIISLSARYPAAKRKLVEDKANGPAVISTLKRKIVGLIEVKPEGGKVVRAQAVTPECESGNVFLPAPIVKPWINEFVDECASFPNGANDDQVDAMSQALTNISNRALPWVGIINF